MRGPGIARRWAVPAALAIVGAVLVFIGAPTVAAVAPLKHPYLALGDSITFGYVSSPSAADGSEPYANAANFTGYPTYVGASLGLQTVNAACPGETSTSLLALGAPDAGCASYSGANPLHIPYSGLTQLQFAAAYLQSHPDTKLVTVAIGINDIGLAVPRCGGLRNTACLQRSLPLVLSTLRTNLTTIVHTLRATGAGATIVLVNYYALEYRNAEAVTIVRSLDASIAQVGAQEHLRVADSFDAFKLASDATNGDACTSGLFPSGASTLGPCDLHPNDAGQHVLASAVEAALR
ncbi:MAG: SGNH/GDSL hydrolase family protein [Candidatus Dormibacteraeota bacterium]|nr:SGNH/GDSL hydrolase family protein [Candidatus Dormibacteraeota bacterium]